MTNIRNFYFLIFITLAGWMVFSYITMNEQIEKHHAYAKLINISGKQRMLSQETALLSARVYQNNEKHLSEKRNKKIDQLLENHKYITSNLTSKNIYNIYLNEPYQLDKEVKQYVALLRDESSSNNKDYLHSIFKISTELLPILDFAVNTFQQESEDISSSLREREVFILVGSLSTLFIEYVFIFLPIFKRFKHNEERLIKSKDRFEHMVRYSPDGIQLISMDGKLQLFSHMSSKMLGYTFEEMHRLTIPDWDIALTSQELNTIIDRLSEKEITLFETKHKRKDGSVYDALISARLINFGDESFIYASVKDVTALNEMKKNRNIDALKLKIAAQSANMGIWQWNPKTDELIWDSQMYKIFGVNTPLNVGAWRNTLVEKDRERALNDLAQSLINKTAFQSIFSITVPDGSVRTLQASAKPMLDQNGDVELLVGTNRDITSEQESLNKIQKLNWQLNQAQKIIELGYWELDHQTQELFWSDQVFSIFEQNKNSFLPSYENFLDTIHPDDRNKVGQTFMRSLEQHKPYNITHRLLMNDGRIKYVKEIGQIIYDKDEKPVKTLGTIQDITERRRIEMEKERYLELIDKHIITSTTDLQGTITEVSEAFCILTGYSKDELIGHKHNVVRHPDTPDSFYKVLWKKLTTGQIWQSEIKNRNKDGKDYWLYSTFSPVYDDMNKQIGYSEVSQEITDKKRVEEISIRDKLTGLYNRLHTDEVLNQEIEREKRYGNDLSFVIMDLDHFKKVNDTYGHLAGDSVLKQLATILTDNTRGSDCVGRWGGEEFVIICPNTDADSAVIMADKIRAIIEEHYFEGVGHLTSSFGVTQFRESDLNDEPMITRADTALYQAKHQGRNQVVIG